jgi:hypothetical protein
VEDELPTSEQQANEEDVQLEATDSVYAAQRVFEMDLVEAKREDDLGIQR